MGRKENLAVQKEIREVQEEDANVKPNMSDRPIFSEPNSINPQRALQ